MPKCHKKPNLKPKTNSEVPNELFSIDTENDWGSITPKEADQSKTVADSSGCRTWRLTGAPSLMRDPRSKGTDMKSYKSIK